MSLHTIFNFFIQMDEDAIYPAIIFMMAGLGLFTGFYMTKKMEKE